MPGHAQQAEAVESPAIEVPLPSTRPRREPRPATTPKPLVPHAVILHNDKVNGFEYVVRTLRKVFNYGGGKAFWLTLKAHCSGRSCVWSGHKEVAELKADQVKSCGPDPNKIHKGALPLRVSVEPMPG